MSRTPVAIMAARAASDTSLRLRQPRRRRLVHSCAVAISPNQTSKNTLVFLVATASSAAANAKSAQRHRQP